MAIDNDLDVGDRVTASEVRVDGHLDVMGPASMEYLDVGQANISDLNVIQANISDLDVGDRVTAFEVRVDGHLDVMGGATMEDLNVIGYSANFENAQEVRVPTPDQPNEAANKAYVDSAIATVQSDVDQNELDADAAIAAEAVARDSAITAAIAIVQSDVDQNELDADAAIAAEAVARDSAIIAATTGDISANSLTTSGTLTVSGNAALSGNVAIDNDLDVGDRVTASEVRVDGHLDVMGPASMEYLDVGQANISDLNVIQANISDLDVGDRVTAFEVRVDGHLDVMGGATMEDLNVIGYSANFENAQEVRVPTPDQPNEAANKAYVDSAIATENTKELVQLAVTENVPDISEYYLTYESSDGAANPEQGDLVLLAGQTVASENGIYEVSSVNLSSSYASNSEGGPSASDYYVTLIRSTNFDSADEFITGSFVFIEKGSSLGEGYVLGELASNFCTRNFPS